MIEIINKEMCCGCEACVQICPRSCITFKEDNEGFRYPLVDRDACIECGQCEAVCPVLHPRESIKPLKVYAAINRNDEVRANSSSGGVFTLLAEEVIAAGGVVCGAIFDEEWCVKHTYTEDLEGLAAMRGSKYTQSRIDTIYRDTERLLKSGRRVLFSGTPCQVAGLRRFLRADYDNLLCVDFICHGVPSPKVWRGYLSEFVGGQVSKEYTIEGVTFRDKRNGGSDYGLHIWGRHGHVKSDKFSLYDHTDTNVYMQGFLQDIFLRPSCHSCPSKSFSSGSDITIADFWCLWRYLPQFDDKLGVNMVTANSPKGEAAYDRLDKRSEEVSPESIQQVAYQSAKIHRNRKKFFEQLDNDVPVIALINRYATDRLSVRLFNICVKVGKFILRRESHKR